MVTVIVAQILVSFDNHRPGDLVTGLDEATATAWAVKGLAKIAVGIDPAEVVVPDGTGTDISAPKPRRSGRRSTADNGTGDATLPAAGGEQG